MTIRRPRWGYVSCPVPWANHERCHSAAAQPATERPAAAGIAEAPLRASERTPPNPTRTGNLTTTSTLPPVEAPTGFAALGVPERIDNGLAACGFAQPFAIQTEAVPVAMQGRDVCGRAKTGSGKTLAFGVPMLARITDKAEPRKPLGLVLVPTRELAVQVAEVLEPIATHAGMRVVPVYGGASRHTQIDDLARGVELVVATPLRLIDLLKSNEVDLGSVQIVCLDEADRMADDGFTPQVEWILRHCTGRSQTMLFSATLDGDVGHLIRHYLTDPIEVAVDSATATVGTMHHLFLAVHHMDKARVVGAIGQGIPKILVFCQTKRLCDRVDQDLHDLGVNVAAIHGDLPQKARERALQRFAEGKLHMLIATDVAARGIDIDDIGAVIHFEPAKDGKDYLHRSGPHGTRRPRRVGGHAGRVQPAHPDADPAACASATDRPGGRGVLEQPDAARPGVVPRRRHDRAPSRRRRRRG